MVLVSVLCGIVSLCPTPALLRWLNKGDSDGSSSPKFSGDTLFLRLPGFWFWFSPEEVALVLEMESKPKQGSKPGKGF